MLNAIARREFVACITAFMFLTRFPTPKLETLSPEDNGRSLSYFPLVGLIIGTILVAIASTAGSTGSPLVISSLILIVWVFSTGGLHLDGLADSADGWLGGTADKERTLKIMKDPVCGSAAVMTVSCLLIAKFAALTTIITQQQWVVLLMAPVIGRCVPLILFLYMPYASDNGLATDHIRYAPRARINLLLMMVGAMTLIILGQRGLFILVSVALVLAFLRSLMMKRLGGNTGDTTGASLEIIELTVLISASFAP